MEASTRSDILGRKQVPAEEMTPSDWATFIMQRVKDLEGARHMRHPYSIGDRLARRESRAGRFERRIGNLTENSRLTSLCDFRNSHAEELALVLMEDGGLFVEWCVFSSPSGRPFYSLVPLNDDSLVDLIRESKTTRGGVNFIGHSAFLAFQRIGRAFEAQKQLHYLCAQRVNAALQAGCSQVALP